MIVIIAVMIFAFLVTVAFSVDIAYMHLVRSELRTATDAASKAATQTLAKTNDRRAALEAAQRIAAENLVAGKGLSLAPQDVLFGNSNQNVNGSFVFTENRKPLNSVRINARRTAGSPDGSVPLHFGRIFSINAFQPTHTGTATFIERDIVLVVDRSGSMQGQKFADLKSAVALFVNLLLNNQVDEQVGLASYSSAASEDTQMTPDLNQINVAMNRMNPNGFTSISAGISAGQNIINRGRSPDFVERTMIVLTDGIHNTGISPEIPARDVAQAGVIIHTIAFGNDADEARMQAIARLGSGRYFNAQSGTDLRRVFEEIALTLSTIITE